MITRTRLLSLAICGIGLLIAVIWLSPVAAAPAGQESTPTAAPEQLSIADEVCLGCHSAPGQTYSLASGELLDLSVNPEVYAASVHGQSGYACVQCHRTIGEYPHPPLQAENLRQVTLQLSQSCQHCHTHQFELAQDGVHATALQNGNIQAATCSDCHGAHDVRRLNDPQTRTLTPEARLWIPQTCARCHSLIYEKYKESVHGAALIDEGNLDVPTCIDCHGVHNIEDPRTAAFRLKSPQICARCHTDPKVVGKYGLSTEVLNTYVADFHGTTVAIFEKQSPDAEINKPVCYDCHGVHDIKRANDPEKGLQVKENLLARCQVCHPDANANFPDAWLSHYIPSPEKAPLVYYVNLFYKFFIPGTLGFMAVMVMLDFSRRMINRTRRQPKASPVAVSEPAAVNLPAPGDEASVAPAEQPAGDQETPASTAETVEVEAAAGLPEPEPAEIQAAEPQESQQPLAEQAEPPAEAEADLPAEAPDASAPDSQISASKEEE